MPFEANWYRLHQVIDIRFWGEVSMVDTDQYVDACMQLLSEAHAAAPKHIVHQLCDTLDATHFPPMYLHFTHGIRLLRYKNRGTKFLIAANSTIKRVVEVTARVSGGHFPLRIFDQRHSAIAAVESYLARDARRTAPGRAPHE